MKLLFLYELCDYMYINKIWNNVEIVFIYINKIVVFLIK